MQITMGQTDVRAMAGCMDSQKILPEGTARFFGLRDKVVLEDADAPSKSGSKTAFVEPGPGDGSPPAPNLVEEGTPPDDTEPPTESEFYIGEGLGGEPLDVISRSWSNLSDRSSLPSRLSSNFSIQSPQGRAQGSLAKPPLPPGAPMGLEEFCCWF